MTYPLDGYDRIRRVADYVRSVSPDVWADMSPAEIVAAYEVRHASGWLADPYRVTHPDGTPEIRWVDDDGRVVGVWIRGIP